MAEVSSEWLRPTGRQLVLPGSDGHFDTEKDRKWTGPFTFVQAADTQFGFLEDTTWGGKGDGHWDDEIANAERFVRCVNALSPVPRFVCVCGDLVHALPKGLKKSSDGGLPSADRYTNHAYWQRQNADFKAVMRKLNPHIPLVCVCGNHDIGDRPTQESLHHYTSEFGDDYFSFWCGGLRAFVLNTQLFNDSRDAPEAQAQQAAWFGKELEILEASETSKRPKHVVVFQHHPCFLRNELEPKEGYFNMDLPLRKHWLTRMKAARVSKVFCGHYHRNAGGYTEDGKLEVVVTSAVGRQMSAAEVAANTDLADLSDTRSGMRIVSVGDERIEHQYHEFADLEFSLGILKGGAEEQQLLESLDKRCRGRSHGLTGKL